MSASLPSIAVVASAISTDLKSAPRIARELGFSGLQLPLVWGGVDLTELTSTGHRDVRRLLSTQEQQLVSISFDLGNKGFCPGADVDRLLDRVEAALHAARGLGALCLCIDLGPLPQPPKDEKPKPKISSEMAGLILLPSFDIAPAPPPMPVRAELGDAAMSSQVDAAMFELGRRADRVSLPLGLRSELSSFAALERSLRTADCPWFGVDLDPVSLLRDEWKIDEVFSRLGPHLTHVRARDAVGGPGGRTKPARIGAGDTDWAQMLALLDEAGYHGWMTIDPMELPDRQANAVAGLNAIRG